MKQKLWLLLGALAFVVAAGRASAQITAAEFNQSGTTFNLQSIGGVPISTVTNVPPGSSGKLPVINSSGGLNPATSNQFQSLLGFGGVLSPTNFNTASFTNSPLLRGTNAFSAAVAQAMGLPVGTNAGAVAYIEQNAQIGVPYVSAPAFYQFGSVISPPVNDVNGVLLTTNAGGYWVGQPYATANGTNYYYSPNAGVVFATQPGQIAITWMTTTSYVAGSSVLASYVNPGGAAYPSFYTNGANIYLLYTATYIVTGLPVKPPQTIYWTEGSFASLGHLVSVPNGTVFKVNPVFNSQVPAYVSTNAVYADPNYNPPIPVTNTIWFTTEENGGVIHAYNVSGRVFVELLGPPSSGGNYEYLGFEIVDLVQAPSPNPVTISLGNQLTPYQDGFEGTSPTPAPINLQSPYCYLQPNTSPSVYYADQYTPDQNDLQVYWLTTGVAGIQWPDRFVTYSLVWPGDPAQYSHYVRPLVASQAQAAQTAVQLDGAESPSLDYWDPLDQQRAFLTTSNTFYTWLSASEPAQRALLRFNAGNNVRFERVFSWLDLSLKTNGLLAGTVATNLTAWNPANSTLTNYAAGFNPPYVTNVAVAVGQAITPPAGERGSTNGSYGDYWAGYINTNYTSTNDLSLSGTEYGITTNLGNSYDAQAYVNPFANGFAAANQGAIIPVNAIPGKNGIEVWWFRQNNADATLGFQPVYWPSVIGDYTISWPAGAPQIVLAGNAGSGPLDSLHAAGSIYYQNDPTQPGYNPNEEHALMLAGQAYALRDDLNRTNAAQPVTLDSAYSSAPFVLLSYTGADGRPAMSTYQVRREAPEAGILFDYVVTAGTQLQPPLPLGLMAPPIAFNTNYPANGNYTNYDQEPANTGLDLPAGWTSGSTNGPYSLYQKFTFIDRKNEIMVYRGPNAGLPPLQAGYYNPTNNTFTNPPAGTAFVNQPYTYYIHVSRLLNSLTVGLSTNAPGWLNFNLNATNGLSLTGTPTGTGTSTFTVIIGDTDGSEISVPVTIRVYNANSGNQYFALGPLAITSSNQYSHAVVTYTNRPPSLAAAPTPTNSFTMRFYYPTQPGFAWPGIANPPGVGAIVPYLRSYATNGGFAGDATSSNTASLDIVYRPTWPGLTANGQPLPTLNVGQTLTTAIQGLTAVRGQDSVQVLYQQSIATNAVLTNTAASVVLFDPTAEKTASLSTLGGLPASVVADAYNALEYFPNLPPNLISRFWYDPNTKKLVLAGQYVHDVVNGDYVMLNVLRGDDLAAVNGLCLATDPGYAAWTNAVANLTAAEYTFYDNPLAPGSYVINTNATVVRGTGDLLEITNSDTAVDSYAMSATGPGQGYVSYVIANGQNPSYAGDPVSVCIARVGQPLFQGNLVVVNSGNSSPFSELITFQHTADLAGRTSQYAYDWRIIPPVNGVQPTNNPGTWTELFQTNSGPVYTLGASGVLGLGDNYVSMRYGQITSSNAVLTTNWSAYTTPILAQGWIKRVSENIDPVAGQTGNLYENPATTTASLIALAGSRWVGDVPLNAATLTNNGLIQVFETVLNKGKSLSINSGINYGPANQALLLAAGYLNDLYTTLGNDAWANSLNPTISIGTDNQTYGDIATSQFVFEGQEPTLLEQNLALLRGRDDSLSPGVDVPPVYNHLWWNYTYGLNAGEVLYALNYNITDQNGDGVVNAADAAVMYPQGHGDAYGHYLTALMNYFELIMNPNFDWVPQSEAVSVLGATVQVNYQDEQKFAASAAALARTGRQVFDLTWREDYVPGTAGGWGNFATNYTGNYTYVNNSSNTVPVTRYWGMDHWAARVGQGTYYNWVVGNAILPPVDTNPNDQGIEKVDRTTVQDLQELPSTAAALEQDMDNANAGFNPLGLSQNAIAFDINPNQVTGADPQTHFEQIYARAVQALNNAVTAFNAAENVTADLRQQQNSLSDLQAAVTAQELAYNDQLIELYGTPYPDDIGAGQTYPQGYTGPDLIHYMYVDGTATNTYGGILPDPTTNKVYYVDIQNYPASWYSNTFANFNFITQSVAPNYLANTDYIAFNVGPDGFTKPASWTSERASVGSIQTAAAAVDAAQDKYRMACYTAVSDKQSLDKAMQLFNAENAINSQNLSLQQAATSAQQAVNSIQTTYGILSQGYDEVENEVNLGFTALSGTFPTMFIFGVATGGDQTKAALYPAYEAGYALSTEAAVANLAAYTTFQSAATGLQNDILNYQQELAVNQNNETILNGVQSLSQQENQVQADLSSINQAETELNGTVANYQTLVSQGNRLQQERLTFRQHTAAQVQGYTVANAAFLTFQNEDLERYTTLFNLAAEYTYLAANAYDYETGLLGTPAGQSLINQIISSCALGVVQNGQPQISGTSTGDPGLANALAEMNADFQVLKGRLGFNNPDGYGTIVSLRKENYRINSDSTGDNNWQQVLEQGLVPDLLADTDVKNNCLQVGDGSGAAVPGIELTFSTTITDGQNLFGQPLGPGDHDFSSSSFATKIFAMGVDFDGYVGMDNPVSNSGAGGTSPSDPTLDPNGLAATPYVYLIPCGADSMRSPPLGDTSTVRTWNVDDVAIPLPFNIGASDFSSAPFYQSADSLSEPLFAVRKQQAFRPVSSLSAFNTSIYGASGALQPSQYTNQRLIGRSVWNSKWKLIIPGYTLLADPNQGLQRFINSVKDIHLYFVTYSYAGN